MAELCCVLGKGWECDSCDWKWCQDCLEARVSRAEYLYVVVDDIHQADTYCIGRVKRYGR